MFVESRDNVVVLEVSQKMSRGCGNEVRDGGVVLLTHQPIEMEV